jgi:hypothetical protein
MLVFVKAAAILAATITSLLGVWQAAKVIDVQIFATLPGDLLQSHFTFGGFGARKASSDTAKTTFGLADNIPDSVIFGEEVTSTTTLDHSFLSTNSPAPLAALTPTALNDPSREKSWPKTNQEAASSSQDFTPPLASFDHILNYLFSFVQERPTSSLGALQFSVVAVFVLGFVFVSATALYWALPLISLRNYTPSAVSAVRSKSTEVVASSEARDLNILSIVSGIVQSVLDSTPSRLDSSPSSEAILEILALATDIAGARSDAVGKDLKVEIGHIITNNQSQIARMVVQERNFFEQNLRSNMDDATKVNKDNFEKAKKELEVDFKSTLDSTLKYEIDSLKPKFDSKADSTLVAQLSNKLDEHAATSRKLAQKEANSAIQKVNATHGEEFEQIWTKCSNQEEIIATLHEEVKELKSNFKAATEESLKKGRENEVRLQKVVEEQKAHRAQISKISDDAVSQKADINICKEMGGKMSNTADEVNARLADQHINLKNAQKTFESQMNGVKDTLGKQQADFETFKQETESQGADLNVKLSEHAINYDKLKTSMNSKAINFKTSLLAPTATEEISGKPKEQLQDANISSPITQTSPATSDPLLYSTEDVAGTSPTTGEPPHALSQQTDWSDEMDEQDSNLHEPCIKINPESAAKGAHALSNSAFAYVQRKPLADLTNKPRVSTSNAGMKTEKSSNHGSQSAIVPASKSLGGSAWATSEQDLRPVRPGRISKTSSEQSSNKPATVSDRDEGGFTPLQRVLQHPCFTLDQRMRKCFPKLIASYDTCADFKPDYSTMSNEADALAQARLVIAKFEAPQQTTITPIKNLSADDVSVASPLTSNRLETSAANEDMAPPQTAAHQQASAPAQPPAAIPRRPKYQYGNGPGPAGGQRRMTASLKTRNTRHSDKNVINKALQEYGKENEEHARKFQDEYTGLFEVGSPWEWLNRVLYDHLRLYQVKPPRDWKPPFPVPEKPFQHAANIVDSVPSTKYP